jgi:hypothetical protein
MPTRTELFGARAHRNPWTAVAVCSVTVALALAMGCGAQQAPSSPTAPVAITSAPASVPTPATLAACNQQPNMASALDKLKEARGWLDQAEHNKGGWRDAATAATDTAIQETQRGCAYAENH